MSHCCTVRVSVATEWCYCTVGKVVGGTDGRLAVGAGTYTLSQKDRIYVRLVGMINAASVR